MDKDNKSEIVNKNSKKVAVNTENNSKKIEDFSGFMKELFEMTLSKDASCSEIMKKFNHIDNMKDVRRYTKEAINIIISKNKESLIDPVTGLFNIKEFKKDLNNKIEKYNKERINFSLSFIKIDEFNKESKNWDTLLGKTAQELENFLKETGDDIYSYSRGVFAILSEKSKKELKIILEEKLLNGINEITFSGGIVEIENACADKGNGIEDGIITMAEQLLMCAGSKNEIVTID